jgi:hypothetical protein
MSRTLTDEDLDAIVQRVSEAIQRPPAIAIPLRDAMKLTGFTSTPAFHEWARKVGLRSMRDARGRYAIDSIRAACERASRPRR